MLHTESTSEELLKVLRKLMSMEMLTDFRLVGGTALSLLRGHRVSEDIDLFTYQEYGTVDFAIIEKEVKRIFPYVRNTEDDFPELKKIKSEYLHLYIGQDETSAIKTDIQNWNDAFYFDQLQIEGIRFASEKEIAVMKLDAISRGGRKKDFWDLSELLETYALKDLLSLYKEKYPWYNIEDVLKGLKDYSTADNMPDPICLKGKDWETIKKEISGEVDKLNK